MVIIAELKTDDGILLGLLALPPKDFKTGSKGFYASGKVSNPKGGASYQVGANIVLIGSKGGGT
jgi:hypothetical protein